MKWIYTIIFLTALICQITAQGNDADTLIRDTVHIDTSQSNIQKNVEKLLEGKVAGFPHEVKPRKREPEINSPKIIVEGIEVDEEFALTLKSEHIKKISVLKREIYGEDSRYGVLLIRLKRRWARKFRKQIKK